MTGFETKLVIFRKGIIHVARELGLDRTGLDHDQMIRKWAGAAD